MASKKERKLKDVAIDVARTIQHCVPKGFFVAFVVMPATPDKEGFPFMIGSCPSLVGGPPVVGRVLAAAAKAAEHGGPETIVPPLEPQ